MLLGGTEIPEPPVASSSAQSPGPAGGSGSNVKTANGQKKETLKLRLDINLYIQFFSRILGGEQVADFTDVPFDRDVAIELKAKVSPTQHIHCTSRTCADCGVRACVCVDQG